MGTMNPRSRTRISILGAALVGLAAPGCGGGGSSGATPTSLAFTVNWEQPVAASSGIDGAANLGFDTPIPPSVNAIRFLFTPAGGPTCCVAVVRGSQAFTDRHIVLANVTEGLGSLEVAGFPTEFAPNDGATVTCPTRPIDAGVACSGPANTLPSFGSDPTSVDVVKGANNVVNVDVYSLPFVIGLNPEDGGTVETSRPDVDFTIVDANHTIDPDVNIRVRHQPVTDFPNILTSEECLDGSSDLPDCSPGGELEVHGLRITSKVGTALPEGLAELRIRASNTADPVRDMESNTTFNVNAPVTTTTTTESTTTTLPPEPFCLQFVLSEPVDLVGLSFEASYGAALGEIPGSADQASCFSLVQHESLLATFNDDDETSTITAAYASPDSFTEPDSPTPLLECDYLESPPLDLDKIAIQVTEATAPDLTSTSATVTVEEIECPR